MSQRLSIRNIEVGDYVEQGFGDDDTLLVSNVDIEQPEDIEKLREKNVAYCIVREQSETISESDKMIGENDHETISAEEVIEEELEHLPNLVEKTNQVYSSTMDRLGDVFDEMHQDPPSTETIEDLDEQVDKLMHFVDESPASVSVLTQIQQYGDTTFNHSVNVSVLSLVYGDYCGFDRDRLRDLGFGALVHDIGKTEISREIVQKEGNLTDEEWDVVKDHPKKGQEILEYAGIRESAQKIAYQHHERPDGSGYPEGNSNPDHLALIVSVFDVFEALTAPRPYKNPINPLKAYKILKEDFFEFSETRKILQGLIKAIGYFPVGCLVRLSNGDLAVVQKNYPENLKSPVVQILKRGDDKQVEQPFKVDLSHVNQQKQMIEGRIYDNGIEISEVLELSRVPQLREKIADVFKDQGFDM